MPLSQARTNASVVRARAYVAVGAILVLLIAGVNLANLVSTRVGASGNASSACAWPSARAVSIWRGPWASRWGWSPLAASPWRSCCRRGRGTSSCGSCPRVWPAPRTTTARSPASASLEIDGGVTAVVAVLALLTMAGASLLATRTSLRGDLVSTLKSGGDRSSTRGPGLGERVLLVVQVAASLGLIASAGLVLKSVTALDRVNPGFDADA